MLSDRPTHLTSTPAPTNPGDAEHAAAKIRARRLALAVVLAWSSSIYLDVLAAQSLAPGKFGTLAGLRIAGSAVAIGAWIVIRAVDAISPRALRVVLVTSFAAMNVLLAIMAAVTGGIGSPYFGGALVVLAAYGIVSQVRWTRGVAGGAIVALAFPATMALAAFAEPSIAAQFGDEHMRAIFNFDTSNIFTVAVVTVIGGHMAWSLRRRVFEARSLGRYKLKEAIGAGGMGEVWLAYHHGLKRDVAVKILRTEHTRDPEGATRRFEREVRATTELTHPNTVRILDYGVTDDGLWYYVMEFLVGENLSALVEREGPQPTARALHFVLQAARALAEAHAKGIVHRDIKPENLLVTTAGGEADFVKVLDFGIAKVEEADDGKTLTKTGSILGSPLWLSPEACSGKPVGAPADVYALGAVLHFLLVGAPPFDAATAPALVLAHLTQAPPALPEAVPSEVASIVARALAKDPATRFQTAKEMVRALAACADASIWIPRETRSVPTRAAHVDPLGKTEFERTQEG